MELEDLMDEFTPLLTHLWAIFRTIISPFVAPFLATLWSIYDVLHPIVVSLLDRAAILSQESPAIVSAIALVAILYISLSVLALAKRVVMFWTRIVFSVLFYGGIVVVAWVVYERGVGRTAVEVGEWVHGVGKIWGEEYKRWQGVERGGTGRTGR